MKLVFDIEGDGLLDTLTQIHCIVIYDLDAKKGYSLHGDSIRQGLKLLSEADALIGHNIIKYDIPALKQIYPSFSYRAKLIDTLVMLRLFWPNIRAIDYDRKCFPNKLIGSHSLNAWGHRLGEHKGDFNGPWDAWSPEMQAYCEQDVRVSCKLYETCLKEAEDYPEDTINLEHKVAEILFRQEQHGLCFDKGEAASLYAELTSKRAKAGQEMRQLFPAWTRELSEFTPKRDNKKLGYKAGVPVMRTKQVEFNPNSRDHIANRLMTIHGWQPSVFTPSGKPQVDESILSQLPYPEAKDLSAYLTLTKRLGQLAEGKEAWLKAVSKAGRIHGSVNTNGAVTGRMTHSSPNIAQVPSGSSLYGHECRSLFVASEGKVLVGCDADALELRCLAGMMAHFDRGEYIKVVLEGDKAKGTDIHSRNARAIGLDPRKVYPIDGKKQTGRDIVKIWFYAFIYGAGNEQLGYILGNRGSKTDKVRQGKASRLRFENNLPALASLIAVIKKKLQQRGYLLGIDKRKLWARSSHSALNTVLQSAGAVFMKKGLAFLDTSLQEQGLIPGTDYEFVANIHDEWQIECSPEYAEIVGKTAVASIRKAGDFFSFPCPLDGQYQVGSTWAETH